MSEEVFKGIVANASYLSQFYNWFY